jgi:hypothetical protein
VDTPVVTPQGKVVEAADGETADVGVGVKEAVLYIFSSENYHKQNGRGGTNL